MNNLIVLGSGRSGTSMLAGSLSNSGYFLGAQANYLDKNRANPKGFFEDYEVNTINEEILKSNLINIPEFLRKSLFPSFTFYRARWLARLPLHKKIKSTKSIEDRIEKIIKAPTFCYKDPRFSYTLPIWQELFKRNKIEVKYLVVFREPNKTAKSIVRECKESEALQPLKMNNDIALKVWKQMYLHILENYKNDRDKGKWMFIHYDQLFSKKKLDELERFTTAYIDKTFPDKTLSRNLNYRSNEPLPDDIFRIYSQLNTLSNFK